MIPTRRNIWLLFILLILAIGLGFFPGYNQEWKAITYIFAGVLIADVLSILGKRHIQVERDVMNSLSLGAWANVDLTLHNRYRYPMKLEIFDHVPQEMEFEGLPVTISIPARNWVKVNYRVKPVARGPARFEKVQVRMFSVLGLWKKNITQPLLSEVKNYPNFSSVMKYTLLATDQRLNQMGILKKRRRGEGLDFHQLREYRDGDSLRQIDWKATARTHKLISRDYQEERDQQVIFLVDCGRRMLAHDDQLSHFDHTLNAILLLSHVALRQGDAVGLMTFSGDERWIPPRKSIGNVNSILNSIYDLQPSLKSPDYSRAATELMKRQKRRALVILITNLRDEDTAELLPALHIMRKRHLVLLASMQESAINKLLNQPVYDFESALNHASAQHYLGYRRDAHQQIDGAGVLYTDVMPQDLPINIVNRYLEVKSSGQL
ncbi:MAG: DUF58 domain-containing protein [Thioalkalispiraceae bacterium]|jgi:uncharacterized protein (DUF58 family)